MKKARLATGVLLCLMLPAFWTAARWERKMSAHISDGKIDFSKPIKVKVSEDKKEIRKYNDFYANGKS